MKIKIFSAALPILLLGCNSTQPSPPMNICETYPGNYPSDYTYLPEKIPPIMRIEPKYPTEAYKNKLEGYVKLSFTIVNGNVKNIKVIESSPTGVFDQSAISALSRWKYKNTYKNCVEFPKEYNEEVTLGFNVNG